MSFKQLLTVIYIKQTGGNLHLSELFLQQINQYLVVEWVFVAAGQRMWDWVKINHSQCVRGDGGTAARLRGRRFIRLWVWTRTSVQNIYRPDGYFILHCSFRLFIRHLLCCYHTDFLCYFLTFLWGSVSLSRKDQLVLVRTGPGLM